MNYTSADFHLHYISSYTLYIQSDTINDHLIVVGQQNEILVYMTYDNLTPPAEAVKLLSLPFSKVHINIPQQNLVWVPSEVYEESEKEMYLDYFADITLDDLKTKEIEEIGAVGLYNYDVLTLHKWRNIFPEANIQPSFEIFLRQSLLQMEEENDVLGIQFYDNQADIFLFVNNEMRLYNSFEIATVDDVSFFILSIMKNFSISGKLQKIIVSGVNIDSEWGVRLKSFCQQIVQLESAQKLVCENDIIADKVKSLNILTDISLCV